MEKCATRYGIRRVPKIGLAGGILVKDIDLQDGVSPLSWRWEDQLRCSFEIVGDSLLVVNWMNGDFRIYEEKVAAVLNAAMEKVHFIVCSGWATFRNVTAPPARHVRRKWNTRADSLANDLVQKRIISYVSPVSTYELLSYNCWRITFDGASKGNPGPAAAAWILWGLSKSGWIEVQHGGSYFENTTSVMAESWACSLGVEALMRVFQRRAHRI